MLDEELDNRMSIERKIAFGCVADDDSGATDQAGMLTADNVRTVILIDVPPAKSLATFTNGFDAAVIATHTRSIEPDHAKQKTAEAIDALRLLAPAMYQIKYCSTFDSTQRGNIGPSIDAAMDALDVRSTVVVPALPINGRTTYLGHHFVNGQLLSESSMKDHPLNPMRDSNLVRFLQHQTSRKVGLASHDTVRAGPAALRKTLHRLENDNVAMIVVDAVDQTDLRTIAQAVADHRLVTGGSGIAMELPAVLETAGHLHRTPLRFDHVPLRPGTAGVLAIAGSCSQMTQTQNTYAARHGFEILTVDAANIVSARHTQTLIDSTARTAAAHIDAGRHVLVSGSGDEQSVTRTQAIGQDRGMTVEQVGLAITHALAEVAQRVLDRSRLNKLIVAGGETSGHVCRHLELAALEVGKPIDPGVPFCFSMGRYKLAVALKSGNFGSEEFYVKASEILNNFCGAHDG